MIKRLILIMSILGLSACATPYQPAGLGGGYSDMQLNDDTYKVSFRGNGYSSHEHVQNLLLYRCAELTKNKGYKYFAILSGNVDRQDSQFVTPATISTQSNNFNSGSFSGNRYGNSFGGNFNSYGVGSSSTTIKPSQVHNVTRYQNTAIIKMFHTNKKNSEALKVDTILESLGSSIGR